MSQISIQEALNIAIRHHQAGRLAEAESIYKQVLAVQPNDPDALNCLGMLAHQVGQNQLAAQYIKQAIRFRPSEASYYNNLGLALMGLGQTQAAIEAYQNALRLKPDFVEAFNNLGNALNTLQQYPQAMAAFVAAIKLNPRFAQPHYNLGCVLKAQGLLDDAVSAFRSALKIKPDLIEAYNNLGVALNDQSKTAEAIAVYRSALQMKPDMAELHINLGNAFKALHQYPDAMNAYRRAIELKPDAIEAHNNLANILLDQGRIEESIAILRAVLKFSPQASAVHSNLIYNLHYRHDTYAQDLRDELANWNRLYAAPLKEFTQPHSNNRDPRKKLKIGYVSPDFRAHVVGWNLLPLLKRQTRQNLEIFCYSGVVNPDEWTEQIKSSCHTWRSIVGVADQRVAQMIREDQIDILVDLALHTAENRLLVFAFKPAPVQVTWLGYPGTSGLDAMDYRLSDPYLDPLQTDLTIYREQTMRLPQTYWCYLPGGSAPQVAHPPALSAGFITFGCLNNFAKVSPKAWAAWAQILQAVPRSRLLVHSNPSTHLDQIRDELRQKGIASDQIEFIGTQPWLQYMLTYNRIDVALDPFPYNGGITTCDSVFMGVPAVSLAGQMAVGRAGKSILTNVGLSELIADSPQQYVDIAVKLAGDLPRLCELRKTLRRRMENSPLMNPESFANNIEAVFRDMWRKWCLNNSQSS